MDVERLLHLPGGLYVDLEGGRIGTHSGPSAEGYDFSRAFGLGVSARSGSVEGLSVAVDEVLG